jgi:hypothetical protein
MPRVRQGRKTVDDVWKVVLGLQSCREAYSAMEGGL